MKTRKEIAHLLDAHTKQVEYERGRHTRFVQEVRAEIRERDVRIHELEEVEHCLGMENNQLECELSKLNALVDKHEKLGKEGRDKITELEKKLGKAHEYQDLYSICKRDLEEMRRNFMDYRKEVEEGQACDMQGEAEVRIQEAEADVQSQECHISGKGEIARSLAQAIDWVLCDRPEAAKEHIEEALLALGGSV